MNMKVDLVQHYQISGCLPSKCDKNQTIWLLLCKYLLEQLSPSALVQLSSLVDRPSNRKEQNQAQDYSKTADAAQQIGTSSIHVL